MKKESNNLNKILTSAEKEMLNLNHPYVGSEHLILALLKINDIKEICEDLINQANDNSGKDNISVILSKID